MANRSLILATLFIFFISESHAWLPAYLSPYRGRADTQGSPIRPSHAPLSRHYSRPFISSYHLNNHAKNKIDSSDDDDDDDNADMVESSASTANTKNSKSRIGPLGGRKRKKALPPKKEKKNFLTLWNISGLILFLLLAKSIFLDGFSANSNFAYYESSVYETRMYNSEGKLETSRKESFRSNIPSLVERQQKQQQEQNEYSSTSSLTASPTMDTNTKGRRENILSASDNSDGFEGEVIKDMERMLRTQDIILDGFLR